MMKKCLSFLLVLLLLSICCSGAFAVFAADPAFVPVMRLVVASDTHVKTSSAENARRIGAMMDMAYDLADGDSAYSGIDALLVCGDLTDNGTAAQFDLFQSTVDSALRNGTRFLGVVARGHDGFTMPFADMRNYYASVSGNTPEFHTVINGYHFIGVSGSSSPDGPYAYNDPSQVQWLREQLALAVAEDAQKPVFVMHHEHVYDTVYGSSEEGWGLRSFSDVLAQYPQVVDFSGHSHYPLNDPRSLWQGAFTAIGTGAIYYAEFWIDGKTVHPEGYGQVATCWIVEADAQHRIRLRGMDVLARQCLCEYILDNPADPANRSYTPEKRAAASEAPVFAPNAAVRLDADGRSAVLTVPAAQSTDGMPVVLYRAAAVDEKGKQVASAWTLPRYYTADTQETITLRLSDLPDGAYTVRVTAQNAYNKTSAPLETTFAVGSGTITDDAGGSAGGSGISGFFQRIAQWFRDLFRTISGWFRR